MATLREMNVSWLGDHTNAIVGIVNYIPIVATVVTSILSLVLARATLRYVEATDKGLELAHEEFEREWSPDLHIKLQRVSANNVDVVVTNLAKTSVLLQLLQLRKLSHAAPSERLVLNDPLVGGTTWTHGVGERLTSMTGPKFEGVITASLTFYAAGRMYRTDWFRFQVLVHNGNVLRVDAVVSPGRRVRVIQDKERASRGLVKDVAEDALENSSSK
jgi:hypothetical protein